MTEKLRDNCCLSGFRENRKQSRDMLEMAVRSCKMRAMLHCTSGNPDVIGRDRSPLFLKPFKNSAVELGSLDTDAQHCDTRTANELCESQTILRFAGTLSKSCQQFP